MSVVGRFEILSPIFSGALDTSTARDPRSGDTVLLHLLPPGHPDSPRDLFVRIASDWPGQVLDSGIDPETQRPFVITEYPKDRKAFRLLIHELGRLKVPGEPGAPTPTVEPVIAAPAAAPPPPAPESDPALDLLAFFKAQTAAPAKPAAPVAEPPAAGGATRLFDPSAVFGSAAVAASAAVPEPARPVLPQDGATRIFDPSAVFGAAAAPVSPPAAKPPVKADDGATRMFDPSAVFGAAAPPSKPAAAPPERELADSAKRAADAFIAGKLPPEFRNAPRNVQRSLEELLGRKSDQPDVTPTPGRPGVITLMFDAYGKRIERGEAAPAAESQPAPAANANDGSTKIISSADLSAMFAAQAGTSPSKSDSDKKQDPPLAVPEDRR